MHASPPLGSVQTCAETGERFTIARDGCSFNYATTREGAIISDKGVDIRERRELLDRSRPFTCYLSSDGRHVTGWKGNILGTDAGGTQNWGNAVGVRITGPAHHSTVRDNLIAYSGFNGVRMAADVGAANALLGNLIHGSGDIGIDLAEDGGEAGSLPDDLESLSF